MILGYICATRPRVVAIEVVRHDTDVQELMAAQQRLSDHYGQKVNITQQYSLKDIRKEEIAIVDSDNSYSFYTDSIDLDLDTSTMTTARRSRATDIRWVLKASCDRRR